MLLQLDLWIALYAKLENPKHLLERSNAISVLLENMLPQRDWRPATSVPPENMLL